MGKVLLCILFVLFFVRCQIFILKRSLSFTGNLIYGWGWREGWGGGWLLWLGQYMQMVHIHAWCSATGFTQRNYHFSDNSLWYSLGRPFWSRGSWALIYVWSWINLARPRSLSNLVWKNICMSSKFRGKLWGFPLRGYMIILWKTALSILSDMIITGFWWVIWIICLPWIGSIRCCPVLLRLTLGDPWSKFSN